MLSEGSFPLSDLGPGAGQQTEVLLRSQACQGGVHGTGRVYNIVRKSTLYMEQLECTIFSWGVQCTMYMEQVECIIFSGGVQCTHVHGIGRVMHIFKIWKIYF